MEEKMFCRKKSNDQSRPLISNSPHLTVVDLEDREPRALEHE